MNQNFGQYLRGRNFWDETNFDDYFGVEIMIDDDYSFLNCLFAFLSFFHLLHSGWHKL